MSTKTPAITPTKSDLLKALKLIEHTPPASVQKLIDADNKTDEDMNEFKRTNSTYLRLSKAQEKASDKRYAAMRTYEQKRGTLINTCRKAIYSRGCTPAVIKMVQKIINQLS